jgi:hypothetical protein
LTVPLLVFFAYAWLTSSALAAEFHEIADIESSTSADDIFPVSNLIQGPGVGFDHYAPHDKLLGGADGDWVTAAPGGFPSDYIEVAGAPVLTIDLGQDKSLSEINTWGFTITNANGVSEFSLRFATDAEGPAAAGSSISFNPTYFMTMDDITRQTYPFGETIVARYVELTASDNFFVAPGDGSGGGPIGGDRIGLGEVAFPVPEPASLVLEIVALVGVATARLRSRK